MLDSLASEGEFLVKLSCPPQRTVLTSVRIVSLSSENAFLAKLSSHLIPSSSTDISTLVLHSLASESVLTPREASLLLSSV